MIVHFIVYVLSPCTGNLPNDSGGDGGSVQVWWSSSAGGYKYPACGNAVHNGTGSCNFEPPAQGQIYLSACYLGEPGYGGSCDNYVPTVWGFKPTKGH